MPLLLLLSQADAGGYTDAATVYLDLQPSGVELAQYTDSATVLLDLQPSGTDIQTFGGASRISQLPAEVVVAPTSAKARISQVPAEAVILPAFEYTDAATVYLNLQPLVVEEFPVVYLDLQPSGVDEYGANVDAATVPLLLQPSGVDVLETLGDFATIPLDLQVSGSDIYAPPCLVFGEGTDQLRWAFSDASTRWAGDAETRWIMYEVLGTGQC